MNSFPEPPDDIKSICGRPGQSWTEPEQDRVIEWLFEDQQLVYLLTRVSRWLGSGTTKEDAEDAWHDFYLENFISVIKCYKPSGGDFLAYLWVSLKHFCWRRGKKLRDRGRKVTLLVLEVKQPDGNIFEIKLEAEDRNGSPEETLETKQFLETLCQALNKLRDEHRKAFVLRHFCGLSDREIAEMLGAREGTVKVWRHRACERMAKMFREEGWVL